MAPEIKQHYQQIAEEGRQKYDQVKKHFFFDLIPVCLWMKSVYAML
jgi:hypothetical protein